MLKWTFVGLLFLAGCTASDFVPLVPHGHHPSDITEQADPAGQRIDEKTGEFQPSGIGWFAKVAGSFSQMDPTAVTAIITAILGGGAVLRERRKRATAENVAAAQVRGTSRALANLSEEDQIMLKDRIEREASKRNVGKDLDNVIRKEA